MLSNFARLFRIKTRPEAYLVIYALAAGSVQRGAIYLQQYPGFNGKLLCLATTGAVFVAGGKILDCLRYEQRLATIAAAQPAANDPA